MVSQIKSENNQKNQPFLHLNMDEYGHVCMLSNQINQQYYQNITVKDILLQLQKLIYNPSVDSSYPSALYSCYNDNGDNLEYYKLLNEQAKHL